MNFQEALAALATQPTASTSKRAELITDYTEASTKPGLKAIATSVINLDLSTSVAELGFQVRQFDFHGQPAFGFVGTRDGLDKEGNPYSSTSLLIALQSAKTTEAFTIRERMDGSFWAAKLGGKLGDPKSPEMRKLEGYVEQVVLPLFAEDITTARKAGKVSKLKNEGGGSSLLALFAGSTKSE